MAMTFLALDVAGTGALAAGLVFFAVFAAIAYVIFRLLRKTVKMAFRLAIVVAVLAAALAGTFALWWFNAGTPSKTRPAATRPR